MKSTRPSIWLLSIQSSLMGMYLICLLAPYVNITRTSKYVNIHTSTAENTVKIWIWLLRKRNSLFATFRLLLLMALVTFNLYWNACLWLIAIVFVMPLHDIHRHSKWMKFKMISIQLYIHPDGRFECNCEWDSCTYRVRKAYTVYTQSVTIRKTNRGIKMSFQPVESNEHATKIQKILSLHFSRCQPLNSQQESQITNWNGKIANREEEKNRKS